MLQDFTITEKGMMRIFVPKDFPTVKISVNLSNGFTTISTGGGRKDFFDNVKSDKAISDELNRILERVKEKL